MAQIFVFGGIGTIVMAYIVMADIGMVYVVTAFTIARYQRSSYGRVRTSGEADEHEYMHVSRP